MPGSRGVLVLGMHRSGTSAVARGLQALGVYLGDNFLDTRPDNPTGYWEDKGIVDLSERVLGALGLRWEDVSLIEPGDFREPAIESLRLEAVEYLERFFAPQPLWGFKDPRAVRILPFWRSVLRDVDVGDTYVIAIRNPLSVAASLFQRQHTDAVTAHRQWLVYLVPFLREIAGRPFVVVDYDLLMADPRGQLERIARALSFGPATPVSDEIDRFATDFLDERLRHSVFARYDFDPSTDVAPLTREAYLWLYELATDRIGTSDTRFWSTWASIQGGLEQALRVTENQP